MPTAVEAARTAGETVKQCPGCLKWLPLGAYARRKDRPVGISSRCKVCRNAQTRAWHLRHPTYGRDYVKANPERMLSYHERQAARWRAIVSKLGTPPDADAC